METTTIPLRRAMARGLSKTHVEFCGADQSYRSRATDCRSDVVTEVHEKQSDRIQEATSRDKMGEPGHESTEARNANKSMMFPVEPNKQKIGSGTIETKPKDT